MILVRYKKGQQRRVKEFKLIVNVTTMFRNFRKAISQIICRPQFKYFQTHFARLDDELLLPKNVQCFFQKEQKPNHQLPLTDCTYNECLPAVSIATIGINLAFTAVQTKVFIFSRTWYVVRCRRYRLQLILCHLVPASTCGRGRSWFRICNQIHDISIDRPSCTYHRYQILEYFPFVK